jgi:hypothetical protein
MEPPKITYRDPVELRLHPLQKAMPDPDKASPEWHSFVDALSAAGPEGTPPLICTREGLVMDGGRRWRAAKQLQWTAVPVIERPEHEAASLIVDSLFGQRNMTRGAKAYLALGLLGDWARSSEKRRLENLRHGVKNGQKPLIFPMPSNSASDPQTIAEVCARWGISRDTFEQARRVHDLFHDPKGRELLLMFEKAEKRPPAGDALRLLQRQLRAEFEPQLVTGEKNLWNVTSAVGGRIATEDKPRADQLDFFGDLFSKLRHGAAKWASLPRNERARVISAWKATYTALPDDLRAEMRHVIEEEA